MKRTLKIIIACGSGCCTSTLCKNIISELAQSEKIPAEVSTCSSMELPAMSQNYDVQFTTMPYKFPEGTRYCLNVFPIVTGMNAEKCTEQIRVILREAYQNEGED